MARVSWLHDSKRVSQRVGFYIRMSSGCIPHAIRAQSTGKSLWPHVWSIIWPVSIKVQMANSSSVHWPACTLATSWKSHLSLAGLRWWQRDYINLICHKQSLGRGTSQPGTQQSLFISPDHENRPKHTHTRTHAHAHTHTSLSLAGSLEL